MTTPPARTMRALMPARVQQARGQRRHETRYTSPSANAKRGNHETSLDAVDVTLPRRRRIAMRRWCTVKGEGAGRDPIQEGPRDRAVGPPR